MDINQYSCDAVTVLEVAGRVDSFTAPQLRAQLYTVISEPYPYIVVDLSGVTFIDSSGLAALVHGMRSCRNGGGNLCLANPQPSVRLILELTRLDSAMEIFPNEKEAIAWFHDVVLEN